MRKVIVLVIAALLVGASSLNRVQAAAGDLDPTFGNGGKVITDFSGGNDFAYDVAIQEDQKLVVVGTDDRSDPSAGFALARYNPDGSLDSSFGVGGKVTTKFTRVFDTAFAVAIQRDRKIIAAGTADISGFALARYNPDGSLDPSFGVGGKVITDLAESGNAANDIVIQPDGKIVAAGRLVTGGANDFVVVRYNPDGSLDTTFGTGGRTVTSFRISDDVASGVALQRDGKIVAVGYVYNGGANNVDFAVARYTTDGELDASFGEGGKVITTLTTSDDHAFDVEIQRDGKIVVGGGVSGHYVFGLARYNSDGSLDAGFGQGGTVLTQIPDRNAFAFGIALQPNGKILAAGDAMGFFPFNIDFALARYNADGSLDSSFGDGGIILTDFGSTADSVLAVAVQRDGKIVAIGRTAPVFDYDFAVARYEGDGPGFDICLKSGGEIFQINSETGDYEYTDCDGLTIGGTGTLRARGCAITFQHNAPDRRVIAMVDTCRSRGTATVQTFSPRRTTHITDLDITGSCACGE